MHNYSFLPKNSHETLRQMCKIVNISWRWLNFQVWIRAILKQHSHAAPSFGRNFSTNVNRAPATDLSIIEISGTGPTANYAFRSDIMIQSDPIWSNPIRYIWSNQIRYDPIPYDPIRSDMIQSHMIQSDPIWSNPIRYIWSNPIRYDPIRSDIGLWSNHKSARAIHPRPLSFEQPRTHCMLSRAGDVELETFICKLGDSISKKNSGCYIQWRGRVTRPSKLFHHDFGKINHQNIQNIHNYRHYSPALWWLQSWETIPLSFESSCLQKD